MTDPTPAPIKEAQESVDDAVEAVNQATDDAVEEVIEAVAEPVADATDAAQEATGEAAEHIEDAVEAAVEANPDLSSEHADQVYERVMNELREAGVIPSGALVQEISGDAVEAVEVADDAPDAIVPEIAEPVSDVIAPRREHWYTRPRRVFGRTW